LLRPRKLERSVSHDAAVVPGGRRHEAEQPGRVLALGVAPGACTSTADCGARNSVCTKRLLKAGWAASSAGRREDDLKYPVTSTRRLWPGFVRVTRRSSTSSSGETLISVKTSRPRWLCRNSARPCANIVSWRLTALHDIGCGAADQPRCVAVSRR
jgi:hypothetical protein